MSELGCAKLLHRIVERENKLDVCLNELIEDFGNFWNKEFNAIFSSRLTEKKKEEENCRKLQNRIDSLKTETNEVNSRVHIYENKISEIQTQLKNVESDIQNKLTEKQKLEKQNETLKKKTDKLRNVFEILKYNQSLYSQYLGCKLTVTSTDTYTFYFFCEKSKAKGSLKFIYNEYDNHFTILDIEPKEMVTEHMVNNFEKFQDMQSFLCLFRQLLFEN